MADFVDAIRSAISMVSTLTGAYSYIKNTLSNGPYYLGLDGDISASVINGTTSLDPWKTIKSRSYRMKYVDHIASELKNSELVTAKLPHVPPGSIVELDQPYSLPGRLLEYQKSLNWDSETADPPFALSWAIELPISEPATTKWYKKASRGRRREFERVKLTRKEFIELHREVLDKGIHRPWPPSTVLAILVGKIQQPGTIESYLATLSKSESELPIIWAPDDPANAILSGSLQLYLQLYEGKLGKNSSTLPEIPETMSTTLNTQIMSNDLIQSVTISFFKYSVSDTSAQKHSDAFNHHSFHDQDPQI